MSAYMTHLSFGIKNYKCMDDGLVKRCIKEKRHAYFYGLAGPDIFFYDLPNCVFGKEKAGCQLHEKKSGAFVQNMCLAIEKLSKGDQPIGIAYLAGFICHYELDATTHPYIYEKIDKMLGLKGSGRHFEMEAAFDVYASVSILGKLPSQYRQNRILSLNGHEKKVITKLYEEAFGKTFATEKKTGFLQKLLSPDYLTKPEMGAAYLCTAIAVTCLHDSTGLFEKCLSGIEKAVLGYSALSPLYCNDHTYDLTVSDWSEYRSLCEDGLLATVRVMDTYEKWWTNRTADCFQDFLNAVGNKSYHYG